MSFAGKSIYNICFLVSQRRYKNDKNMADIDHGIMYLNQHYKYN